MNYSDIILAPVITEKSEAAKAEGKYTFKVDPLLNLKIKELVVILAKLKHIRKRLLH